MDLHPVLLTMLLDLRVCGGGMYDLGELIKTKQKP